MQRTDQAGPWPGTLALIGVFALSSCSSDPPSSDSSDDAGTTTSQGSTTDSSETTYGSELTDSDDSVDGLEDAGMSFYAGPTIDLGWAGCDPWQQDCPEGEKCVPHASYGGPWDANKCVPILGDGQPGEPCTSGGSFSPTDDCGVESICWNAIEVDGQLIGQCAPLCGGDIDDPQCGPGTSCVLGNFGVLTVCGQTCLPVLDDCPQDLACTFMGLDFNCVVAQGVPLGQPCVADEECEAGAMCLWKEIVPGCVGSDCCAAFCDLAQPGCTMPGTECVAFFDEGTVDPPYDQQGICIDLGA